MNHSSTPLRADDQLRLLTVHAHPDDEASKGAPTMARYNAEGVRTVLVCCTGGEEGDVNNPALKEPGQVFHGVDREAERALLSEIRPRELAESAQIIGFHNVIMLGYRDSGMAESESNSNPDSLHKADLDEAAGRLVRVIRSERPHVIVTYGDEHTGYPHPDHIKVHEITVPAFDRAGDSDWYPDAGEPWQPLKMYYSVWSHKRMRIIHETMLRLRGSSPFDEDWFKRPEVDHRLTTRLEIGQYYWARSSALRAHATQVDAGEAFWFGLNDDELAEVYPYEDWILARSLVASTPLADGELEDDFFAGIRAESVR